MTIVRTVTKRLPVIYAKALTAADEPGTFEAIVATFGNVDPVGDIVEPGSFAKSISAGLPPVVWTHDWMTPPVGVTLEMSELTLAQLKALAPNSNFPDDVTGGLYGKARLLVNQEAGEDVPVARQVYAGMLAEGGDGRPAIREFSWSGAILAQTIELVDGAAPEFHLTEIDAYEWGPCLKGMNPETILLAAKAAIDHGEIESSRARKLLGFPGIETTEKATGDDPDALVSRQVALAGRYRDIVSTDGKFDKTAGGNGACYDADGNPYASRGIQCSNCIFYTPDSEGAKTGTCDLVAGAIDAIDLCKLWIIPAGKISGTSGGQKSVQKAALPVTRLDFAPRDTGWDEGAARAAVREFAGGDTVDFAKYAQAFLWVDDGDTDQLTAYRFPVATVIDGALKYVAHGVFAAANVLSGGQGGTNVDAAGVDALKSSVEQLYARMRTQFDDDQIVVPWADQAKSQLAATPEQRLAVAGLLL